MKYKSEMESNFESNLTELTNIQQHPVFERINIFIYKSHTTFNFDACQEVLKLALDQSPQFQNKFFEFLETCDFPLQSVNALKSEENPQSKCIVFFENLMFFKNRSFFYF
jgi:hypothetical protein